MRIKECPFCASPESNDNNMSIQCSHCKASGPTWGLDYSSSKNELELKKVIVWNIRSEYGDLKKEVMGCPFCGGHYLVSCINEKCVICENCGCNGPKSKIPRDTIPRDKALEENIIELWDRRTRWDEIY